MFLFWKNVDVRQTKIDNQNTKYTQWRANISLLDFNLIFKNLLFPILFFLMLFLSFCRPVRIIFQPFLCFHVARANKRREKENGALTNFEKKKKTSPLLPNAVISASKTIFAELNRIRLDLSTFLTP